jgi:hypothetical protein
MHMPSYIFNSRTYERHGNVSENMFILVYYFTSDCAVDSLLNCLSPPFVSPYKYYLLFLGISALNIKNISVCHSCHFLDAFIESC